MTKNTLTALIILLLNILVITSYADIYKHTDKNGIMHFTNIPKGRGYKKIITEVKNRSHRKYDQIINTKSSKYNIKSSIIEAVITVESNWDPRALSQKGAIGLMQLMPSTASDMQIRNPYNPEENIEGGTRYLRYLMDRFDNNLELVLAAYNAGPSRVEKSGGIPPFRETRLYVKSVLSMHNAISKKMLSQIYKVTLGNGTILYTNTPDP